MASDFDVVAGTTFFRAMLVGGICVLASYTPSLRRSSFEDGPRKEIEEARVRHPRIVAFLERTSSRARRLRIIGVTVFTICLVGWLVTLIAR